MSKAGKGGNIVVCSVIAEDLCHRLGINAIKPDEVEILPSGTRLLIALPDDEEGRRETALASRLARINGLEYRVHPELHQQYCDQLGIPWTGRDDSDLDDGLPPIVNLADLQAEIEGGSRE